MTNHFNGIKYPQYLSLHRRISIYTQLDNLCLFNPPSSNDFMEDEDLPSSILRLTVSAECPKTMVAHQLICDTALK